MIIVNVVWFNNQIILLFFRNRIIKTKNTYIWAQKSNESIYMKL